MKYKEMHKRVDESIGGSGFYQDALGIENYNEIKDFIESEIERERERIVELIEREIRNYENAEAEDNNCNSYASEIQALQLVADYIKGDNKIK